MAFTGGEWLRILFEISTIHYTPAPLYLPREYFVLTDAGKPVFISRPGGGDEDGMASTIGIIQALISVFLDDNDKLRSINAGRTRITFLLRPPLYYACASSWGEPESVTRSHLEYLHLQILSIVTGTQLKRIFERRTNFDLRRLLSGAEPFMNSLLARLETDMAMSMSSLHCLKMEPNLRKRIAEYLVPNPKMKDMLYIIMIANNRVVTLIRPRKHSIHPADLHIILNTLHSPSIYNSPANASWIPVCLPKFNPAGFVNAYITFLRKDDAVPLQDIGGGELELIRNWCNSVINKLSSDGTLKALVNAYQHNETDYSVSELGIPGLRHFIYKSRTQVQITLPNFEDPYDQVHARKRITTLYQTLHDSIHAKSGQDAGLKLQYIRTDTESVMGWITQPFELYVALSPLLPKSAAVGAANAVARWVKREEARLFLKDAPVF
ncbi:vacuolar fusion protein MON1 [Flammula alnicola]|nr:vacuolar fusion protein MON1 [Flammula alnicola]